MVEGLHQLRNIGSKVQPMNVEQIHVAGLQLSQAGLERQPQALSMVVRVIDLHLDRCVRTMVVDRGDFGGKNHLIAILAL